MYDDFMSDSFTFSPILLVGLTVVVLAIKFANSAR